MISFLISKLKFYVLLIGIMCFCLTFILPNTSYFSSSLFKEIVVVLGFLILLTNQILSLKEIILPKKAPLLFILFLFLFLQYLFKLIISFQDLFFNLIYISVFFLSIIFGLNSRKYNQIILIH